MVEGFDKVFTGIVINANTLLNDSARDIKKQVDSLKNTVNSGITRIKSEEESVTVQVDFIIKMNSDEKRAVDRKINQMLSELINTTE
jgi:hypothetical protein